MKKVVARAIITDKNKVLLGKRARNDAVGKWALIGGKPHSNETIEEAIVREVKEELGLLFKPNFWKEEIDSSSRQGEFWEVSYFYGPTNGEIKLKKEEISEIMFVDLEDLERLDIAYDHKEILVNFFQEKFRKE